MGVTLNTIKAESNWGYEVPKINQNFTNVNTELDKLKNATTKFKGYFTTLELLKQKYPTPTSGDTAWVGTPYPGKVYNVSNGQWTNTNTPPETGSVVLNDYYTKKQIDARFEFVKSVTEVII